MFDAFCEFSGENFHYLLTNTYMDMKTDRDGYSEVN